MVSNDPQGLLAPAAYERCELCPRACGADRTALKRGVCGQTVAMRAGRAALHLWEEPPISGNAADESLSSEERDAGSGTIFFTGCPLGCVYCQNDELSSRDVGWPITEEELAHVMLELQAEGALNVNLVTALHFAPGVARAVELARARGLAIPIVANTSGYERPELVRALAGVVDVWLADFKYASADLARRLSHAPDYPKVAASALAAMVDVIRSRGGREEDARGHLRQGVIVRHLTLPGEAADSVAVLECVWAVAGNECDLSLMDQYTPNAACKAGGGALASTVDRDDYEALIAYAYELGFERVWWQRGGAAEESFIPAFDGRGLPGAPFGV